MREVEVTFKFGDETFGAIVGWSKFTESELEDLYRSFLFHTNWYKEFDYKK